MPINSLVVNLAADARQFVAGLGGAQNQLGKFAADFNRLKQSMDDQKGAGLLSRGVPPFVLPQVQSVTLNVRALADALATAEKKSFSLFDALGRIGLAAAGIRAVFSTLQAVVGTPLRLAAEAEAAAVQFRVLTGDAAKGAKLLAEIRKFAIETPFQEGELIAAGRQVLAFGTDAKEVVKDLRMLGDIASATGGNIGDLAWLYGQFRVQNTLYTQDLRQLTSRGIPALDLLAERFGVTKEEVMGLASNAKIKFADIEWAFKRLTAEGGRFAGMTTEMSQSASGRWSTFKDSVTASLRDVGTAMLEELDLKQLTKDLTALADFFRSTVVPVIAQGLKEIGALARAVRGDFSGMGDVLTNVVKGSLKGTTFGLVDFDEPTNVASAAADLFAEARKAAEQAFAGGGSLWDSVKGLPFTKEEQQALREQQAATFNALAKSFNSFDANLKTPTEGVETLRAALEQLRKDLSKGLMNPQVFDALTKGMRDILDQERQGSIAAGIKKRREEMEKAANSMKEQFKSPLNRFRDSVRLATNLQREGLITPDIASAAIKAARETFQQSMPKADEFRPNTSFEVGTREALEKIAEAQYGRGAATVQDTIADGVVQTVKLLEQLLAENRDQTKAIEDDRDVVANFAP